MLADEFGKRGLKILAFPCNQFGGQEPGTHEQIIDFVKKIDPTIPDKMVFFEKNDVNGANAREVYRFIKPQAPNDDGSTDIRWNFAKFLVDHEGKTFQRSTQAPEALKPVIEELLAKKESCSA